MQQFFRPAIVDPLRDQGAGQGRLGDRNNAGGLSKARQMSSRPLTQDTRRPGARHFEADVR
ncbi:MAG: hypothetical protein V1262_02170 [Alphaproteobacteria bacterium]|nr:hypothetical protein [Alphaproteobacteria bacterium]